MDSVIAALVEGRGARPSCQGDEVVFSLGGKLTGRTWTSDTKSCYCWARAACFD